MSATIDLDKISTCGYYTTSSPSVTIGNYTTDKVTVTTGTASVYTIPKSWTYSTSTPVTISYDDICKIYNVEPEKKEEKEMKKKKPQRRENPYTKKIEEHLKRQKKTGIMHFTYIKEYVPNKVYEFTFDVNKDRKVKTICDESDIFDLEKAFYIALAKFVNQPALTSEGYVKKAEEYAYGKKYIKMVKDGIKLFNLLKQEEEFEREEDERIKRKHEKYVQKKKNRALRKKNNANQDLYDTIKKAIEDAK